MQKLMHNMKDVSVLLPKQQLANFGGELPFVSMKNAQHASVLISTGATGGGGEFDISLQQATNVEGHGNKALSFSKVWEQAPLNSPLDITDEWKELDVTANTFQAGPSKRYRIEIDVAQLDVSNGYDCIRVRGVNGTDQFLSIKVQLSNLRYTGEGNLVQPSAKVN